jgi:hypothetical protein
MKRLFSPKSRKSLKRKNNKNITSDKNIRDTPSSNTRSKTLSDVDRTTISNLNNSEINLNNIITMTTITIDQAERMITRFDGDKTQIYEFIENCDNANNLLTAEQRKVFFLIIKSRITGKARALIQNHEFSTWESLKERLLSIYAEKRTMGQWQLELHSCTQRTNESVLSFSNRVENIYIKLTQCLDSDLTDEAHNACITLLQNQALSVFTAGLIDPISVLIKARDPKELASAIALALNEEQQLKSKNEIRKFQNISSNSNVNNFYNPKNSSNFSNPRIKIEPNINKVNYRQQKFCNFCKIPGHVIDECRKRQYFNSRDNNKFQNNRDYFNANINNQHPRDNNRIFGANNSRFNNNRDYSNNQQPRDNRNFRGTNNNFDNANKHAGNGPNSAITADRRNAKLAQAEQKDEIATQSL